jgi:hypothetical protein
MPNDTEDRIRRGQYEDIYRSHVTAGTRDPRRMRPDEIVAEITSLRETVDLAARRIGDLSRTLYGHSRRQADATTPAYIAFANTWTRLAGAIQQGLRRTSTVDRVLDRALEAQSAPPAPARAPKKQVQKAQEEGSENEPIRSNSPFEAADKPLDDLMKLYGQEIVRDAVR